MILADGSFRRRSSLSIENKSLIIANISRKALTFGLIFVMISSATTERTGGSRVLRKGVFIDRNRPSCGIRGLDELGLFHYRKGDAG